MMTEIWVNIDLDNGLLPQDNGLLSLKMLRVFNLDVRLKITNSTLQLHLPGTNELKMEFVRRKVSLRYNDAH